MTDVSVHIDGLDRLQSNLEKTSRETPDAVGHANVGVAGKVEDWSEQRRHQMAVQFPSYGSRIVDIRARASRRQTEIEVTPGAAERGITRHPVFGTWRAQSGFVRKVWPDPEKKGYLVGPSIDRHDTDIADQYLDAVADMVRRNIGA